MSAPFGDYVVLPFTEVGIIGAFKVYHVHGYPVSGTAATVLREDTADFSKVGCKQVTVYHGVFSLLRLTKVIEGGQSTSIVQRELPYTFVCFCK